MIVIIDREITEEMLTELYFDALTNADDFRRNVARNGLDGIAERSDAELIEMAEREELFDPIAVEGGMVDVSAELEMVAHMYGDDRLTEAREVLDVLISDLEGVRPQVINHDGVKASVASLNAQVIAETGTMPNEIAQYGYKGVDDMSDAELIEQLRNHGELGAALEDGAVIDLGWECERLADLYSGDHLTAFREELDVLIEELR